MKEIVAYNKYNKFISHLSNYSHCVSLFQSAVWANFNSKIPGQVKHEFDEYKAFETHELFYIPGITKILLSDLSGFERFLKHIIRISFDKKIALDFQIPKEDEMADVLTPLLKKYGLQASGIYWTPRRRCIVDLTQDINTIISEYHSKTYNDILRAKNKGVKVIQSWDINKFYELYLETSQRQKYKPFSLKLFYTLCEDMRENNWGRLYFAYKEGLPILSSALVCHYGNTVYYMFTGSLSKYKQYNASSLLQHTIIESVKDNYQIYDLMGVRSDYNYGPSKFKIKFGSYIIHLIDCFTNFSVQH
jgi:lipid II:glycine glycyltransferase (peptidoglycan interpeptide bridge formation enzyme)